MEYTVFKAELIKRILADSSYGVEQEQIKVLNQGESAGEDDREKLEEIKSANLFYFNNDKRVAEGDFLYIERPGKHVCRFLLPALYERYQIEGWNGVDQWVFGNIEFAGRMNMEPLDQIHDYEAVKQRLIIRPLNYTDNKYRLKDCVFQRVGDVALVLYLSLGEQNHEIITAKVPKLAVSEWEIKEEDVLQVALINTYADAMPRMYLTAQEIRNPTYQQGAFMAVGNVQKLGKMACPIITTVKKINGAIAIFYPGVRERLAEMLDESFYLTFTSIHEARVHTKSVWSPREILSSLKYVNATFEKEEILSRKVWLYDKDKKTFEPLEL